nr:hypothetical protein [Tanacetum cinerariifolium]
LSEKAQLKEAIQRSKKYFHISQASGSGIGTDERTGTKPEVRDVPKHDSKSEEESWGDSGEENEVDEDETENDSDDGGNDDDAHDNDDGENEKDEEEEDDYEELYIDVNVNLRQEDAEMTKADQGGAKHNVSQESGYEYAEEDAHVTLTTIHDSQKTEGQKQSSSVSSDFTSKFLNLENVSTTDYTIASVMDTTVHQTSSTVVTTTPLPPPSFIPPAQQETPITAPTTSVPTTSIPTQIPAVVDDHLATRLGYVVQTAFESYTTEFEKEAKAKQDRFIEIIDKSIKQMVKDQVKSQLLKILPKEIYDFATPMIKSTVVESYENVVLAKSSSQPKDLYGSLIKSYDLDKTLFDAYGEAYSLKRDRTDKDKDEDPSAGSDRGLKTRKSDKDDESSKDPKFKESRSSSSSKGTTTQPKSSDDQHDDEAIPKADWFKKPDKPLTPDRIEDMVPTLWTPVKVAYEKYALWGIPHWVTHVEVEKWYDYGYLKEIVVRREDQQLYKFKAGDFLRLNMRDIKDLVLLLVQKKLSNLEKDVIFDLNVALRMFTRRIVILKRVEDLQLGVERYRKKLNITRPQTFKSDNSKLKPYTAYNDPQGIIYQDKSKRNRLMRLDELYKFCDETLTSVRSVLHDITKNMRMEYLPNRN